MKYRDVELYYQQTLDDVGTKIIDLRTTDPISAIRLNFFGTNGATSNKNNRINDIITKLELVDGSDQLLSLSMKEAQALQFRLTGKMPFMRPGELNGGTQNEQVLLLFGRKLWDTEYYMDLTKFRNPQLKITTDVAAVRAAGADGYVAGSLKVTIDLHVLQEGAKPALGFFMQKNIYGFTSAASGDEHIDMPLDYPYIGLMMRAFTAGNDVDENISKLKINCDAGKFIPLEKYVKDIYRMEEEDLGPAMLKYWIFAKNDDVVTHDINHDPVISLLPTAYNRVFGCGYSWSGRFSLYLLDNVGAAVAALEQLLLTVFGSCPHSTIYLPFGLLAEPATYFDPKVYGDIDLVLTQAAASDVDLVLVQLRPYGAK